jgi:prefoldin subunit 5
MDVHERINKLEKSIETCFDLITKLDDRLTTLEDSTRSDYDY